MNLCNPIIKKKIYILKNINYTQLFHINSTCRCFHFQRIKRNVHRINNPENNTITSTTSREKKG